MATLNDPELQGQAQLNQVVAFSEFLNELAAQRHSVVKSYIGTPVRFISYSEVVERNDKLLADIDHLIRDTLGHIERTDLQPFDSITNSRQAEATPKTTPQPMTIDSEVRKIVYELLGHDDGVEFGNGYHDDCKQEADEATHSITNLIAQEANKELDRYLVKADPNLIDYAYIKSRQSRLTAGKAKA